MSTDGTSRPDPRAQVARIIELLETDLATEGVELVDVRMFRGGGRYQVRIYVDLPDGGINIGQCTKAARTAGMLLEEADLFADPYVVEVSSPGVRRPLRTPAHFTAAVGQRIDLKAGGNRVRGVLLAATPETLRVETTVDEETVEVEVAFRDVREANLDPDFDVQALINADRRKRKAEKRDRRAERRNKGRGRNRPAHKSAPGGDEDDGST